MTIRVIIMFEMESGEVKPLKRLPELKPLREKAFRPNDEAFDSSLNPVVQAAENAKYMMLDYHPHITREQEIATALDDIQRINELPSHLIPEKAKQEIAQAKRQIRAYGGKVTFTKEEIKYLKERFELDPGDFYK